MQPGTKHQYVCIQCETPKAQTSEDAFIAADKKYSELQCTGILQLRLVFWPNACEAFVVLLTHLAATGFGASGSPAHGGVRVLHRRELRRALEAGADHVATPGLRAHAILAFPVGSVVHRNVTVRALEGVAVDRA